MSRTPPARSQSATIGPGPTNGSTSTPNSGRSRAVSAAWRSAPPNSGAGCRYRTRTGLRGDGFDIAWSPGESLKKRSRFRYLPLLLGLVLIPAFVARIGARALLDQLRQLGPEALLMLV